MINTLFFCNSIPMVILMCRMMEVDTMSTGTVKNPKAAIYAHSSLMSCQRIGRRKVGHRTRSAPYLADSVTVREALIQPPFR